jgi:hypothetical protein
MRLSIISYMRNEADIVESFVRHHAPIVQHMIVVVRPSEDRTEDRLERLRNDGLPLTIIPDAAPDFRQAEALQEAFALAMKDDPDWILPLDGDEFLLWNNPAIPDYNTNTDTTYPASFVARATNDTCQSDVLESKDGSHEDNRTMRAPQDDTTLSSIFCSIPTDAITLLPWKTYVPTINDDPQETNVLRRIRHRRAAEVRPFFKCLIPSSLFDCAQIQTGNHAVLDRSTAQPLATVLSDSLSLAHFPVRSIAQITRKIATGWTGLERQAAARQVFHWHDLHARFAHQSPTETDLTQIALRYALQEDDPTPALLCDPVHP